jgi:hypothetical protein
MIKKEAFTAVLTITNVMVFSDFEEITRETCLLPTGITFLVSIKFSRKEINGRRIV